MGKASGTVAVLAVAALLLGGCAGRSGGDTTSPTTQPTAATTITTTDTTTQPQPQPQPQPTTVGTPDEPSEDPAPVTSLADLDGRAFSLVGLFTDAGGADTMFDDARFVIAFDGTTATAGTHCGNLTYANLTEIEPRLSDLAIDFGEPEGDECTFGTDPAGPPTGQLSWGYDDQTERYWLSTGFVAWYFVEVFAVEPDECLTGACPETAPGPAEERGADATQSS